MVIVSARFELSGVDCILAIGDLLGFSDGLFGSKKIYGRRILDFLAVGVFVGSLTTAIRHDLRSKNIEMGGGGGGGGVVIDCFEQPAWIHGKNVL